MSQIPETEPKFIGRHTVSKPFSIEDILYPPPEAKPVRPVIYEQLVAEILKSKG